LSLNVFNIGLQCNLRFLSTTVLQGSVATRVNDGGIFNDLFIANLLPSVRVKEFWRSVRIRQSYGNKIKWHLFSGHGVDVKLLVLLKLIELSKELNCLFLCCGIYVLYCWQDSIRRDVLFLLVLRFLIVVFEGSVFVGILCNFLLFNLHSAHVKGSPILMMVPECWGRH